MKSLHKKLEGMYACDEALEWIEEEGFERIEDAWEKCERADWMMWLARRMRGKKGWPTHQDVVLSACDCAETALGFVPECEDRPRIAIEVARRWVVGKATVQECIDAAAAAVAYAADVTDAYVAYAAYAACAADAACRAAIGPAAAAAAAAAAAYAADAADAYAGRDAALNGMAEIVRRRLKCGRLG